MKRVLAVALLALCAGALAPSGAAPSGAAAKGSIWSSQGATVPGLPYRYVAIAPNSPYRANAARPAAGFTVVSRIDKKGGRLGRWWYLPGRFSIPTAAFDDTAGGLSADGGTLVLSRFSWIYPPRSTGLAIVHTERHPGRVRGTRGVTFFILMVALTPILFGLSLWGGIERIRRPDSGVVIDDRLAVETDVVAEGGRVAPWISGGRAVAVGVVGVLLDRPFRAVGGRLRHPADQPSVRVVGVLDLERPRRADDSHDGRKRLGDGRFPDIRSRR